MAQRCETTQGIPAPNGPRAQTGASPIPAMPASMPATPDLSMRETIPADRFGDVLRDPRLYSALYPHALPLTHRLFGQLHQLRPPTPPPLPVPWASAGVANQRQEQGRAKDTRGTMPERWFTALLTTAGDDIVEAGTRASRRAMAPIGAELPLQPKGDTYPRERLGCFVPQDQNGAALERMFAGFDAKAGVRVNTNPFAGGMLLPAIGAEVRERREEAVPRHFERFPCVVEMGLAALPEPSRGVIDYVFDSSEEEDEEDDIDANLCMACEYGRMPTTLDMVERGQWLPHAHVDGMDVDGKGAEEMSAGAQGWVHEAFCMFSGSLFN